MTSPADISLLILAGGLGTRLRSVVFDRPKVLADVGGRPFLAHLLDQVQGWGVREAVFCTGYGADQVRDLFGSGYGDISLRYSTEEKPLGTAGAIRHAAGHITSDPFLVMNGDSFCDLDLPSFLSLHHRSAAVASLALAAVPDVGRYGAVDVDETGMIRRFREKGGSGPGLINGGVYLLSSSIIEMIPESFFSSLEQDLFPTLVGGKLYGFPLAKRFIDIGIPSDYAIAARILSPSSRSCHSGDPS